MLVAIYSNMERVRDGHTRWGKSDRERQISYDITYAWTVSLVAQKVKNLPAMQETQVWSLGQEEPLEEGMATHSSVLSWRIPGQKNLAGYGPWGHEVRHDWLYMGSTVKKKKKKQIY